MLALLSSFVIVLGVVSNGRSFSFSSHVLTSFASHSLFITFGRHFRRPFPPQSLGSFHLCTRFASKPTDFLFPLLCSHLEFGRFPPHFCDLISLFHLLQAFSQNHFYVHVFNRTATLSFKLTRGARP